MTPEELLAESKMVQQEAGGEVTVRAALFVAAAMEIERLSDIAFDAQTRMQKAILDCKQARDLSCELFSLLNNVVMKHEVEGFIANYPWLSETVMEGDTKGA